MLELGICYNKKGEIIDENYIFPQIPELIELLDNIATNISNENNKINNFDKHCFENVVEI